MSTLTIRPLTADDWPAVEVIYRDGIATGNATFETEPPSWETFDADRIVDLRLVAELSGTVVGWIAASPVSDRCVYGGVIEHSIYVAESARRQGVALTLLNDFVRRAEEQGVWTIQSGVFPENVASRSLHRLAGFREVGVRERVGKMNYGEYAGCWRDSVLIERRSGSVGID